MNKSKFKSVKFKPMPFYNRYSWEAGTGVFQWTFHVGDCVEGMGHCTFTEEYIEQHPELFEVEKAEREFEEGEYYWAKVWKWSDWDAVKYSHGVFYFVGVPTGFTPNRLYLIGGKIGR